MFFTERTVTDEDIGGCVARHMSDDRISRAYDCYLGRRRIDKGRIPEGRPDNRVNTNLAKYITDTATGYFGNSARI